MMYRDSVSSSRTHVRLGMRFWSGHMRVPFNFRKKDLLMIKNIVFDIGKVLVRFDWEDYLASFQFPEEETNAR